MSPALRRCLFPVGILTLAWLVFVQIGAAQLGNSAQIERDFNKGAKGKLNDLLANTDRKKEKDFPLEVLDAAAKYYVYRITWPHIIDGKSNTGGTDDAAQHVKQFHDHIVKQVLPSKANDPTFANVYSTVLVARFKELTDLPVVENSRALVHGTQMLPSLAKLQHDSIAKYLLQLLDPKAGKHDLIKLGAIKALREFMPIDLWADANIDPSQLQDKGKMARKGADLERINALTQFILRPPPAMAKPEELEAYRYLRREAIESLAEAKAPAFAGYILKGKGEVEGPIAPVLLSALIPGAMTPETNLYERNEAALGLCMMRPMDMYAPGPTYYFINQTLFELARDYSEDFANIAGGDKRSLPTKFPWKITAKRWEAGLKQLIASADKADKKKAEQIESRARPVLKQMFDHKNVDANDVAPELKIAPLAEFSLFKAAIKSAPLKWEGAK